MNCFFHKKGFGYLQSLAQHELITIDIFLPVTSICLNNDIYNDNRFFLHNPMSFNRFILINMLELTIQSISFHIGSQSRTFRTVWQHRHVPPLITDKLSLLVNCRVKLTGTSQEECAGSTTPTLKLGGSPAPSSGPFWLVRVSSARDEIPCRQVHVTRKSTGPTGHARNMCRHEISSRAEGTRASQKGLLDRAVDPPGFNVGVVDTAYSS